MKRIIIFLICLSLVSNVFGSRFSEVGKQVSKTTNKEFEKEIKTLTTLTQEEIESLKLGNESSKELEELCLQIQKENKRAKRIRKTTDVIIGSSFLGMGLWGISKGGAYCIMSGSYFTAIGIIIIYIGVRKE